MWQFDVLIFSVLIFLCGANEILKKPKIFDDDERILESNSNYSVLCQGMKPLKWILPTKAHEYTTFDSIEVPPINETYKYANKLIISNITFPFVGYYTCIEIGEDEEKSSKLDQIYLYVHDEKHLSVSDSNTPETITVTQGSTAIIPCRPTSPTVKVILTKYTYEETDQTFDPKVGFSVPALDLSLIHYTCSFKNGSQEFYCVYIVDIIPKTYSIAKPYIIETSRNHTEVGGKLVLSCTIRTYLNIMIKWTTPSGPPDDKRMNVSNLRISDDHQTQDLIISNVTNIDKGLYTCHVTDAQGHENEESLYVHVYGAGESCLSLTASEGIYEMKERAGAPEIKWTLNFEAHPIPKFSWLDNNNNFIENSEKYSTGASNSSNQVWLKIKNLTINDFGTYTIRAKNQNKTNEKSLFLNITDKPTVQLESNLFLEINKSNIVKCVATAYPKPMFIWKHKKCNDFRCNFELLGEDTDPEGNKIRFTSYMNVTPKQNGEISCSAINSLGSDESIKKFYISDVRNGFDLYIEDDESIVTENGKLLVCRGETIKITCASSVSNSSEDIKLSHNNDTLESNEQMDIERGDLPLHYKRSVTIRNIHSKNEGEYICTVEGNGVFKNQKFEKKITIVVKDAVKPTISTMNESIQINYPLSTHFVCRAYGIPKPIITWYKNGERIRTDDRIVWYKDTGILRFNSTKSYDEGNYTCEVRNKVGVTSKSIKLTIKNKSYEMAKWLKISIILVFVIILILLIIAISIIFVYKRKQNKLQKVLSLAGLANFEKGAIESINPDLGIDDQAELLPYDKKWEFPIEKLKLGKQLGSGAFGVVMKGVAKGIVEDEESTVVAVKMVKKNAEPAFIKALASELKIMVHLGKHLNVVNLLGACTKNVVKRELLVIVEYCRFGNLQIYLYKHRENFINQIDTKSGVIDYNIGLDILERTYSITSTRSNPQSPVMNYAALACTNSPNNSNQMVDYRANSNYTDNTALTEMTTVCMSPNSGTGEEGMVTSNNSIQPEWRSNYKGDYKGNVKPICTKDLLVWAFQVARGMEYLASRKILHGDLAARNILLADNEIVKICDFGLAKTMYKNDNYKKKGDGPLPVKWMAIESIRDRVFSTQSDVWSFGIVMWEFFSLARTPYPGMQADEHLYRKLIEGYRMQRPEYSTKEIYKMMLDCWQPKPLDRPSFPKLAETIGSMLEDSVRRHYIDLNDPYLVMNTQRLEDGHSDYLAMLSPPDFENLSSPHYINDYPMPSPGPEPTPGYLCMKANNIFSPRAEDSSVFDFNLQGRKSKNSLTSEGGNGPELAPMLHSQAESDCDTPSNSPRQINSFSNPSYHIAPVIESEKQKENIMNNVNIVKSKDNYINMLQNKSALKNKINEKSNPFIDVDEKSNNVHYVNSDAGKWESIDV